ncbi:helix-turn-helix domain-containing protein [Fibrella forsythiae]|uniref:Helix-turn-helix domain-containing protein n=1 Tax=Fibrella forsythiae TaxID=2817061 RepID=A0ABS3JL43_9BACT|nr:helix-turn-helix domain-containing protein [Fibrella forsythiae]MBO0950734.1 helix-turn-helix domain-containing protein [Fibrella forsythiae]
MTELPIKGMVCDRCRRTVERDLNQLGLTTGAIDLGRVEILNWPESVSRDMVRTALQAEGFDLIEDPKASLVEQIKGLLVNEVHHAQKRPEHQNVSDFLRHKLGYDYSYLSQLFSTQTGTTIERFLIAQKVERAKELLQDGEQSISDIAFELGYSSVPHFTSQFRNLAGRTPAQFRKSPTGRQTLDTL